MYKKGFGRSAVCGLEVGGINVKGQQVFIAAVIR